MYEQRTDDPILFWLRSIDQRLERMENNSNVLAESTVKKVDCKACQDRHIDKLYFVGWGSCFLIVSGIFMLAAKWNEVQQLFH